MDAAGVFERHYQLVVRYLARRVYDGEHDIVEDLAQEVFLKAHRAASKYEDRGVSETCWLYRIAHNVLVDHARRGASPRGTHLNVSLELVPSRMEPGVSEPIRSTEARLDVERHLARLTPMQRAVIECRYLEDCTIRETSAAVGTSEDAVKKLQARALVNLRRMLESAEERAA